MSRDKVPVLPDERWLLEALNLAKFAAAADEVPVGALVVSADGEVIGKGHNRRESDQNPLAHAELMAILEASQTLRSWRLVGCSLYVTLEPCPMCLAACQQARLARVFYGARDPKGGALSLGFHIHSDLRTHHRFEVAHLEQFESSKECSNILSAFFKKKRSDSGS